MHHILKAIQNHLHTHNPNLRIELNEFPFFNGEEEIESHEFLEIYGPSIDYEINLTGTEITIWKMPHRNHRTTKTLIPLEDPDFLNKITKLCAEPAKPQSSKPSKTTSKTKSQDSPSP